MRWSGRLEFVDVGMGAWVLVDDDGRRRPLYGDVPESLAGGRVEVSGEAFVGMDAGMAGDAVGIRVESIAREAEP